MIIPREKVGGEGSLSEGVQREWFGAAELGMVGDEVDGMGHCILGKNGLQILCTKTHTTHTISHHQLPQ